MVRHYVMTLIYVFVYCVACESQSNEVFIVYPYKEGDINESKAKFPVSKFKGNIRRVPKILNDTNIHLVYPNFEDLIIMTPVPLQESNESLVDTTTMVEKSTEHFSDLLTTTETAINSFTETWDSDLRSLEESGEGTTIAGEIDTTTADFLNTEIPKEFGKRTFEREPISVDVIYEETGPQKILRKRMFEISKFSRKYPSGLKMNNAMEIPTTMSPANAFKKWYREISRYKATKKDQ